MNLRRYITIFLFLYPVIAISLHADVSFLRDFFKSKNVMLTMSLCWNKHKIKSFLVAHNEGTVSVFQGSTFENRSFYHYMVKNHFIVLDLRNCSPSRYLLDMAHNKKLFRYSSKYLLLTEMNYCDTLLKKIEVYDVFSTTEIFIASINLNKIHLYQPYKIRQTSKLIIEQYGNWTPDDGLVENYKFIPTANRRCNVRGHAINVGITLLDNDTVNHFNDLKFPRVDSFTKRDFPVVSLLIEFLNARPNLRIFDSYGYYNKTTKEWNGIVNDLITGQSDITGTSIYITDERFPVIDYINRLSISDTKFIVRQPSTSFIKNIYLLIFTPYVWYAILVVVLLFIPVQLYMLNWECKVKQRVSKQNKYSVSDVSLISLEALCQQGTTTEPSSYSGRTITLIFFMAFMFLYVSYSAYIVVLLQSTTKINNLNELLDSRIEAGGLQVYYMKHYFELPKSGVLRALYRKKIYPNQYFSLDEGMKKVQDGNFAFHVPLIAAYDYVLQKFTNYDICGLQILPGYINSDSYVGIPKNSPFKKIFAVGLSRIYEVGLQNRNMRRTFVTPKCFHNAGNFQSVRLYDCYFTFLVFVIGVALCLVFLVIEIFTEKYFVKLKMNKILQLK